MNLPSISLIISTYNNPAALDCCLEMLSKGTLLPDQIVICDDGSGEPTRELIEAWDGRLACPVVHAWHEDRGFRKNRILNISLAKTTGDYVIFLDGDCLPSRHFIEDHQLLAERDTFVQGRRAYIVEESVASVLERKTSLLALAFQFKIKGLFKALRLPKPIVKVNQSMRGIIGCNLAIWRSDILDVNGFDEVYEGWGIGEDSDIGARLYNKGLSRKFVYGRATVFHLNHPILPRDHVPASLERLQKTIDSGVVRCELGLDRHLMVDA